MKGRAAWGGGGIKRSDGIGREEEAGGGGIEAILVKYHLKKKKRKNAEVSGVKKYCWTNPVCFSFITHRRQTRVADKSQLYSNGSLSLEEIYKNFC